MAQRRVLVFGMVLFGMLAIWASSVTADTAAARFAGRPEFAEGNAFGYVDVDTERKVIAPGRAPRVVRGPRGRVRGVTGGRAPVVATKDEDRIEQENEQLIRFGARTDDDLDGFEFKVSESARVLRFILEIDGSPRPAEVEVGRENFKPAENPLIVRLR